MTEDLISRRILVCAALSGAIGVLLGAFGAHGLEPFLVENLHYEGDQLQRRLDQFDTGVRYQLFHSVALLALSALPLGSPKSRRRVGRLFVLGIVLFSGSLYALVLSNVTKLGIVTPLGGLSWIVGWLMLCLVAKDSPQNKLS